MEGRKEGIFSAGNEDDDVSATFIRDRHHPYKFVFFPQKRERWALLIAAIFGP